MNTPIQGSAADIIKLAMVKFSEKIKETKYHAKLLLQFMMNSYLKYQNQK